MLNSDALYFPTFYETQSFITVFIRVCSIPMLCVTLHNTLLFYNEELLVPHPTTKPEAFQNKHFNFDLAGKSH